MRKNYGKDIRRMAAHIMRRFRRLSEKQKLINRIIASSDCWSGINDLHPKFTALSARDDLKEKNSYEINYYGKPRRNQQAY